MISELEGSLFFSQLPAPTFVLPRARLSALVSRCGPTGPHHLVWLPEPPLSQLLSSGPSDGSDQLPASSPFRLFSQYPMHAITELPRPMSLPAEKASYHMSEHDVREKKRLSVPSLFIMTRDPWPCQGGMQFAFVAAPCSWHLLSCECLERVGTVSEVGG